MQKMTEGLRAVLFFLCLILVRIVERTLNLQSETYFGFVGSVATFFIARDSKLIFLPLFWTLYFCAVLFGTLELDPTARIYLTNTLATVILIFTLGIFVLKRLKASALFQRTFKSATFFFWLLGLALSSYVLSKSPAEAYEFKRFYIHYLLSILIALCIWFDAELKKVEKKAFVAGLVVANLLLSFNYMANEVFLLLILGSIFCLLTGAFYFFRREKVLLFNMILAMIGLKAIEFFVRSLGPLLNEEMGFLLGIGLALLLGYFWIKKRKQIETKLLKLLQ